MELLNTSAESFKRAATALRNGEVVAYPTETVYGLGVDPFKEAALDRLFEVKRRDREQAILLIVGNLEQLGEVTTSISDRARAYMEAFWPGPLSLLLPKHPRLPEALAPGRTKICVRCPGLLSARQLCEAFGGAITSTSANRSGMPPALMLDGLVLDGVSLGLSAGTLEPSSPSTILDPESGEILREGAITREALGEVCST